MNPQLEPVVPPMVVPSVKNYDLMKVSVLVLNLGLNATFSVQLYNAAGEYMDTQNLLMEGEDYQKWQNDAYVYEWVNQQLHK